MSIYYHEQLYRSPELMAREREMAVTTCGAGALGANIVESLARSGFDHPHNLNSDRIAYSRQRQRRRCVAGHDQ